MMRYAILLAMMLMCLPVRGEAWQVVGGGCGAAPASLSVSYGASGAANSVSSTTIDLATPAGTSDGSLLVATVNSETVLASLTSSGWTTIVEQSSSYNSTHVLYLVVSGTPPSSYTFTANTSSLIDGFIARYEKTSGSWVISDYSTRTWSNVVSPVSFVEVTATNDNSIVHYVYGSDDWTSEVVELTAGPVGATSINSVRSGTMETWAWYLEVDAGDVNNTIEYIRDATSVQSNQLAVVIEAQE